MTQEVKGILLKHLNLYLHEDRRLDSFDESRRLDSLKLDSLDVLELIFDLEEYFAITVEANQLDAMTTLGDLLTAFENQQHHAACRSQPHG